MEIAAMKEKVMHAPKYDYVGWHYKVNRMSDQQICAVYHNMLQRGLLDAPKKASKKSLTLSKKEPTYYQMTIFDFMGKENQ